MIAFIGDVHHNFKVYRKVLERLNCKTFQLGDMGLGFWHYNDEEFPDDIPNTYFLRGNHDNPEACQKTKGYLGDFGYLEDEGIFFISGALSIDRYRRREGIDWWSDEELSYEEFQKAIDLYEQIKPEMVISHDAPISAGQRMAYMSDKFKSRTAQAMERMFEIHEPERWIFGHYHSTRNFTIGKTEFSCLAELDSLTIP